MNRSETIGKISVALAKFQGSISSAKKSSDNPFFKSSYADLAEVWDTIRKPLAENGLSVVQLVGDCDGKTVAITTMLMCGEEFISSTSQMPLNLQTGKNGEVKLDPQIVGSAITYGRRYFLTALLGISQDDDDGNIASGRVEETPAQQIVKLLISNGFVKTEQQKKAVKDILGLDTLKEVTSSQVSSFKELIKEYKKVE